MGAIQIPDLNNGKTDVDFIAEFANSSAPTTLDRLGRTRRTIKGVEVVLDAKVDVVEAAKVDAVGGIGGKVAYVEATREAATLAIGQKVNDVEGVVVEAVNAAVAATAESAEEVAATRTAFEDHVYPGVYATPPTHKPHSGAPAADGDRCLVLIGTTPYEHVRIGGGWLIPNVDATDLALPTGGLRVGHRLSAIGSAARTVSLALADTVNVDGFDGVDRTGVADSSAGFAAAIAHCSLTGKTLEGDGTYRLDTMPVFSCHVSMFCAKFTVLTPRAIAVDLGTGSATNPTDSLSLKKIHLGTIVNLAKPPSGWVGQGIGVRGVNLLSCDVQIACVQGFTAGVLCTAFKEGFVYSRVELLYGYDNQVNMDMQPGDAEGWVNENHIFAGRMHFHKLREGTNTPGTRQIRLLPFNVSNGETSWPNNNVFYKPCIEGDTPEYHIEIGGHDNRFISGRYEAANPKVRFTGHPTNAGKTARNLFDGGYQTDLIVFTSTGAGKGGEVFHPRKKTHSGIGASYLMQHSTGDDRTSPAFRVFPSAKRLLEALSEDNDWTVNVFANGIEGKRIGDVFPRLFLDLQNGRTYTGVGTAAPAVWIGTLAGNPTALTASATIFPLTTGAQDLGAATLRFRQAHVQEAYIDALYFGTTFSGMPRIIKGTGSPEGAATAAIGSVYLRTDGGASTSMYVKETGSGNAGWVAK